MASFINCRISKLMTVRNVCSFREGILLKIGVLPSFKVWEAHENKSWFSTTPTKAASMYSTYSSFQPVYRHNQRWNKSSHVLSSIYFSPVRFQSTGQNAEQSMPTDIIPDSPPFPAVPENTLSASSAPDLSAESIDPSSVTLARGESIPVGESIPKDVIPDPPSIPIPDISSISSVEDISSVAEVMEPSLASLGLAGWTPVGLVQQSLEFLHISCNMPWWLSVAVGTFFVRMCLFPLVIYSQRNAANMNNNLPQMQVLQVKMTEARKSGNAIDAARYGQELMLFMKTKNVNPLKNLVVPLVQAPVFISVFLALRRMANLPVESLKTGGIFWFTNLTIADPLYLLPLITSATLFLTIELGVDGGIRSDNLQVARYVLRALPVVLLPFIINFPACILCYWVTSNFISLTQVALLRLEPVRAYFNIPKLIHHTNKDLPLKSKGFVEGFKDTFTNAKISRNMEDRYRIDEVQFRKAGTGPVPKTYPYDPTKQNPVNARASKHSEYKT